MKITGDYFLKEYHVFRNIMCSLEYTVEQKDEAFKGLTLVYFNIELDDPKLELCKLTYTALALHEFPMRQTYQIMASLGDDK